MCVHGHGTWYMDMDMDMDMVYMDMDMVRPGSTGVAVGVVARRRRAAER